MEKRRQRGNIVAKVPKVAECPSCGADVTLWCDPLVETVAAIEIIAGTCEHIDEFSEQLVDGDFRVIDRIFKSIR